jgi:PTS system N-acetylglucosamine-specific IIC component
MFLAPVLYLVHALLTGVSLVIMSLLNIKLGFGFSAGLFDYIICFGKATNPLLLVPVGAVYFVVYYVMFRVVITRFDLKTIGREPDFGQAATASVLGGPGPQPVPVPGIATGSIPLPTASAPARGVSYLAALGGAGNVLEIDACATRLRLSVVDSARLDEPALKQLGARAVLRLATGSAQVIIGPLADQVASEIQAAMRGPGTSTGAASTSPAHAR